MVAATARVEAVVCASRHEAAWLERNLLETGLPPWNRTPGGQETPVCLELDDREAAPRLRVVRWPASPGRAAGSGPYLGGQQVRNAVSGLHRVYPLAYTGSRLSGAERAMAAERGVVEHDRAALVEALAAVLEREPAAVRRVEAAPEEARQRAVATEAFELAARVHPELRGAAVGQQPPSASPSCRRSDLDFAGWSGGVLVRFGIRAGRLCEWCSQTLRLHRRPPPPRRDAGVLEGVRPAQR